jgi:glycosyltransferase involved in cell wall biosynthesis
MSPYFSIVIPTFNSGNQINTALRSILDQSYDSYEILIVDGLSTDATVSIAESYNNEKIIINSEKDKGIYDAMNKAIKIANGQWLYFLGSDDSLFDKNVLKEVYDASKDYPCDVIYGDVSSSRFNGLYDGEFDKTKILKKNICHQAIFLNRTAFLKVGKFNIEYKVYGDWDHNIRWFFSKKIVHKYVDLTIANYADGGFSSTSQDLLYQKHQAINHAIHSNGIYSVKEKYFIIKAVLRKALHQKDKVLLYKALKAISRIFN